MITVSPGVDVGRVDRGAPAGRDAAADQHDGLQRQVLVDGDAAASRRSRVLAEACRACTSPPTSWPSPWKRNVPSGRQPSRIVAPRSQMFEWPVAQKRQCPQTGRKEVTTWSPSFTRETPGPSFSMIPAPSWPPTIGKRGTMSPWRRCSSEWHKPAATQRISTSPCLGSSRSSSAISQSRPVSHSMAALVFTRSPPSCDADAAIVPRLSFPVRCNRASRARRR